MTTEQNTKDVIVNNEIFRVNDDEFNIVKHEEYEVLQILENLGKFEKIISLLSELISICPSDKTLGFLSVSHGGFIPIKCCQFYEKVFILGEINESTLKNTNFNLKNLNINKISFATLNHVEKCQILYIESKDILTVDVLEKINFKKSLIVAPKSFILSSYYEDNLYEWEDMNLCIYIPRELNLNFIEEFNSFIINNKFVYDNLINLCVMVKNAGDGFEKIIENNLHLVDRWTFLDTGSTDNTVEIIKKVLANKKGTLYQEPFINFRESRNRCLDLAGKYCKYNLMLDDTYVVKGDLRKFLTEIRGDQYVSSYSFFIKGDDMEYTTCRLTKSSNNLRYIYKIHEIIQQKDNVNAFIPISTKISIEDFKNDYMENRTFERKEYDLRMLHEMVQEEPDEPRHLYYIGQTYNILNQYENAAEYFLKRTQHHIKGENTEIADSYFEIARLYNFKLNKPWELCEEYYLKSWEILPEKPDCFYYIGLHYFDNDKEKSFYWFKKAFECGYNPQSIQHSIRPTIYFTYIPYFLSQLAYLFKDFILGEKVSHVFLSSDWNKTHEFLTTMIEWKNIFNLLNRQNNTLPYFCIVADGGWGNWTGSDILTKGLGGSETYVVEISRHIQKTGLYKTIVFCRTDKVETFGNVVYRPIDDYTLFIKENRVKNVLISRYTEYLPVSYDSDVENVYFCAHDIPIPGKILILHQKLKKIFCMSNYQSQLFKEYYPMVSSIIQTHGLGTNLYKDQNIKKIPHKFIYSSFANRGLLPLLQMWPLIINRYQDATLHIYTDVSRQSNAGKWVHDVYKEGIETVINLINNLTGVVYHGWVNKKILEEAWMSSDIWLYPCVFSETFCATALEAAISNTLAITTDLGALKETVGDRGVILEIKNINDPYSSDWQQKMLPVIFEAIENTEKRKLLLEKNYNWAKNLTWENKTKELLELL